MDKESHKSEVQKENYCFFWLKFQNNFQFLRINVDPQYFSNLKQLKRHLSNHFSLNSLPNLLLIEESGKYSYLKDLNSLVENSFIIIEPKAMKIESIFPEFTYLIQKDDQSIKYLIPKYIQITKMIFRNWNLLIKTIHEINFQKDGEKLKKLHNYTVQSLFTDTGDFSDLFDQVAQKLHIDVPQNPEFGPIIRPIPLE